MNEIINAASKIPMKSNYPTRRVEISKKQIAKDENPDAETSLFFVDHLVHQHSLILIGRDGWAYDVELRFRSRFLVQNINVLVWIPKVYSNTGGQRFCTTFAAASAKFALPTGKASFATCEFGDANHFLRRKCLVTFFRWFNPQQTLLAMRELGNL